MPRGKLLWLLGTVLWRLDLMLMLMLLMLYAADVQYLEPVAAVLAAEWLAVMLHAALSLRVMLVLQHSAGPPIARLCCYTELQGCSVLRLRAAAESLARWVSGHR